MSVIKIMDRNEELALHFKELRNYHGNLALMAIGAGFRVLQAGLQALYKEQMPDRSKISIVSGHAGPGFRDAFEYITRAVTRGAYTINTSYPAAQYDPHREQSYAFLISDEAGGAVEVILKPDFLPAVFYDYLKKGREGTMTKQDTERFELLKAELCELALSLPEEELLEVRAVS